MNIIDNYKNVLINNYVNFQGRASRSEYWYYTLVNLIIMFLLLIPFFILVGFSAELDFLGYIFIGIIALFGLATFLPNLAVTVRRLHDSGKSGWFYLISFIPYIGGLIMLVLMCLPSEAGWNKWGPNPDEQPNEINEIGTTNP